MKDETAVQLGKQLRKLRKQNKMTQAEFIQFVGLDVSQSAYSLWERGDRNINFTEMKAIAEKFHIDLEWFTGSEGDNIPEGHAEKQIIQGLGDRIRMVRRSDNKNQLEFLDKCGIDITASALSNWENGNKNPEISSIIKIAKTYGITTDWLLMGTMQESKEHKNNSNTIDPEEWAAFKKIVYKMINEGK